MLLGDFLDLRVNLWKERLESVPVLLLQRDTLSTRLQLTAIVGIELANVNEDLPLPFSHSHVARGLIR